jgi:hypothetical protein
MKLPLAALRTAAICAALLLSGVPAQSGTNCGGGCSAFDNSVKNFQVSGPVGLMPGQTASICATNLDNSPAAVLIALLQADTGTLLATRQDQLAPGAGSCLNVTRNSQPNGSANVIGVVVPNAHLTEFGVIVQDRPGGGGCIVASVQIQAASPNNTSGQTFLYVPMAVFAG